MRDEVGRDGGVSFDGARAFAVGFAAFCAGCVGIDYGTDRIAAQFEMSGMNAQSAVADNLARLDASPAATPAGAGAVNSVSGAAASSAPIRLPRAVPAGSAKAPAVVASPCAKPLNPHGANGAVNAARPVPPNASRSAALSLPAAGAAKAAAPPAGAPRVTPKPAAAVTPPPAVSALQAAPQPRRLSHWRRRPPATAPSAARAALPSAAPAALRSATPAGLTAHAAGGLLVPFETAPALTPSSGLDPRAAGQAPLLINPGAASAPPPAAGSLRNR